MRKKTGIVSRGWCQELKKTKKKGFFFFFGWRTDKFMKAPSGRGVHLIFLLIICFGLSVAFSLQRSQFDPLKPGGHWQLQSEVSASDIVPVATPPF